MYRDEAYCSSQKYTILRLIHRTFVMKLKKLLNGKLNFAFQFFTCITGSLCTSDTTHMKALYMTCVWIQASSFAICVLCERWNEANKRDSIDLRWCALYNTCPTYFITPKPYALVIQMNNVLYAWVCLVVWVETVLIYFCRLFWFKFRCLILTLVFHLERKKKR